MTAIIIDDEPIARKGIQLLADQIPDLNIIGSFPNPLIAQETIATRKDLDILFLDVEMPGITGIEFLKIMPPQCYVILTTAYQQYAIEAFELDVVDYLLKPVSLDRFVKAINKVRELKSLQSYDAEVSDKNDFVYIKSERKFVKLALSDIHYVKGMKDYVIIHTSNEKYMTAMNVGTIYSHLDHNQFARVSKSYIINVSFIDSIDIDTIMLSGKEIPLGRTYKDDFLEKFVKGKLLKR